MDHIAGIPYRVAEFDARGLALSAPQVPAGTTDLIVMSHGWNNSREDAEALYGKLFRNFAAVIDRDPAYTQRRLAIVGVIWPSKRFTDFVSSAATGARQAGGAASAGGATDRAASQSAMLAAIERTAGLYDDPADRPRLAALRDLVPRLEDDADAQAAFVRQLRSLLDPDSSLRDQQSRDDGSAVFFRAPADVVFERASAPDATAAAAAPAPVSAADAAAAPTDLGRAAGLGASASKALNAVTNLLNLTTYFEMKQRAGVVGSRGLAPLLDRASGAVEHIHLIGHSFGARVVSAAAADSQTDKIWSLSLLQAAFSHNGFSRQAQGYFRRVVDQQRLKGPILVTHTPNDTAVGLAYPTASHISRDNASAFGDQDDAFGGLGRNGTQRMDAGEISDTAVTLGPVGEAYRWEPGKFHNLEASRFIKAPDGGDAHGWVHVSEVAWAVSRAMLG